MAKALAGGACAVLLCGCTAVQPDMSVARLRYSPTAAAGTMALAQYDRETGTCTAGSVQLLSAAEMERLASAWRQPVAEGLSCDHVRVDGTPDAALYPRRPDGGLATGAAHLLVLLREDGAVESAHALCATDRDFAAAAVSTAQRLVYAPERCSDIGVRSVFLLPLAFDPD